ncbi:MAG: Periplasmic aromatic aldehyde oxidoreductase, binding subunit YagS [Phycisphaerales bacterium]|nr:Periplasmic aromatic aldehyde oxidoreductase, binding subunit YagS [Phycisphaerales bacterium]
MRAFSYTRADSVGAAVQEAAGNASIGDASPLTKFIGGGTNLIDLMKADVLRPHKLIDLTRLPLKEIVERPDGGLRLGALVTNADTAYDKRVAARYPLLARAILAGASAQLRNVATDGGNLLQRTRCYYFYDTATACNKRQPGSGCDAIEGINRIHAVLGTSEQCIATHPSDMCVALAALAATVNVTGAEGDRQIAFKDFHRLPGETPDLDTNLKADEVITSIDLPAEGFANNFTYLKIRDRASYAFALVSVAAALTLDGDTITDARLALGGVAHKPWRDEQAEQMLVGKPATVDTFKPVAAFVLRDAKGYEHNAFKITLAQRAISKALSQAAGLESV